MLTPFELQAVLAEAGFYKGAIDGVIGPKTRAALAAWRQSRNPVAAIPTEARVREVYGEPGENQSFVALPYAMRLSWDLDTVIRRFACHKLVVERMGAIFEDTLAEYGADGVTALRLDIFGGCLNVRPKRGGSSWSMHSWGIAVDIDPTRNQLKWDHTKAALAKPEYRPFWSIVEKHGAVSYGRVYDRDWQHFQFAKV